MKRKLLKVLSLVLTLAAAAPLWSAPRGPIDLVFILDTSSSMSSSYRDLSDYVSGPLLRENLSLGDTFHLISFSAFPSLELSRRVEGIGEVQTIIGRLFLMYPINPETDVLAALEYGREYIKNLPQGRPKKIVLISDGEHSPPGSSPFKDISAEEARNRITAISDDFKQAGADFLYLKVPLSADLIAKSKAPPAQTTRPPVQTTQPPVQTAQPPVQTTQPPVQTTQPPVQATQPPAQTAQPPIQTPQAPVQTTQPPIQATQPPAQTTKPPVQTTQPPVQATQPPAQTAQPPVQATQPPVQTTQPPVQTPQAPVQTAQPPARASQLPEPVQTRESPSETSSFSLSSFLAGIPLPLLLGLLFLVLLLIVLIIFFRFRNLHGSPNRVVAEAAGKSYEPLPDTQEGAANQNAEMLATYAARKVIGGSRTPSEYRRKPSLDLPINGPLMLSLFVEDQNTAIGKRNIHAVKSGYTFSVGGGKSDFLIFLVPVPAHIAEVRFDGQNCTFTPLKPKYFPDIGSSPVHNCIGETIRVVSDRNYEMFIRIDRYQDPLIALNRLLHSIDVPDQTKQPYLASSKA